MDRKHWKGIIPSKKVPKYSYNDFLRKKRSNMEKCLISLLPPLFKEIIFSSPCIKYYRTCVRNSLTGNNLECKIYIQRSVRGQKRVLSFFSNKEERPIPTGIFKCDHHFMSLTAATYCCTKGMRTLRTSYIHTVTKQALFNRIHMLICKLIFKNQIAFLLHCEVSNEINSYSV